MNFWNWDPYNCHNLASVEYFIFVFEKLLHPTVEQVASTFYVACARKVTLNSFKQDSRKKSIKNTEYIFTKLKILLRTDQLLAAGSRNPWSVTGLQIS